jgi:hypothetical protein
MSKSKTDDRLPVWLGGDEAALVRDCRTCPGCGSRMVMALTSTPGKGHRSRKSLFHTLFANVMGDGKAVRGGIELYLCAKCMVEYAYGPRRTEGGFQMVRIPC